jgi:hypothetical protein
MNTYSRTNDIDSQYTDVKICKEALWHLFVDLIRLLALSGMVYGVTKLVWRTLFFYSTI